MWLLALSILASAQQVQEWPLTHRWAPTPEGYFQGLHRDLLLEELGGSSALADLDYSVTEHTAHLYVPDGYQPDGTWGVFVFVYSNAQAPLPESWKTPLSDQKMIYVAAHEVGNEQQSAVRMALSLDSLASVEAAYQVNPDRRVIGGFSGGGAISVMMGTAWPDVFVGTVDQCRALMWEEHPIATIPGAVFGTGEISHMDPGAIDSLAHGPRFAFLSGDRDVIEAEDGTRFSNYEGMLKGMGDWWERGIRARMFDVPDMSHQTASGQVFSLALDWVLTCRDPGTFPTRFDSDHMPPHTPVATPATAPPNPCDPPNKKEPEPVKASGCGSKGSAWAVALPLLWLRRRRRAKDS